MCSVVVPAKYELIEFCRKSNEIENEIDHTHTPSVGKWYEGEEALAEEFCRKAKSHSPLTNDFLVAAQASLAEIQGKELPRGYRKVFVRVGKYIAPHPGMVPHLMNNFLLDLPSLSSWEAHIKFERIHPFDDLNGRIGRLVWLYKFLQEEKRLPRYGFLQSFYYQSLANAIFA